jgi:type VI secretion system protein ImpJ
MSTRAVHWHEGMFLRPHHFQGAMRHLHHQAARSDKWDVHHNWGLRAIDLDLDALANFRFVVRSLDLRLRDGSLVSVPEDGLLPELDLKAALENAPTITVFIGLPILRLGRANATADGTGDMARFVVDTQEVEDENTGVNPQPVQVRLPNLKLLLSTQEHAGYEVLPVARIEKSLRAEATPQLDVSFIPPVVACDAWKPLGVGIVQAIYDRVGKKIEVLAAQITTRQIGFDSLSQGDPLLFAQLRMLNEGYATLTVPAFAQGVHPIVAYMELCRIVGQLAIFDATRRVPELPHYDHDDLGGCFYRVKQYIDNLLDLLIEPEYKERPFIGAGLRMQVSLEPAWLESAWNMFIGVQSPLETEECIRLLTKPGQLDMKVGSSDRVDSMFRLGQAGLRFAHSPRPPRALPALPGQIYFQLNRETQAADWQNVQKSLSLALRLNEKLIAGNIQGQRVLTIRTGNQTATLQFTLYVVPQSAV